MMTSPACIMPPLPQALNAGILPPGPQVPDVSPPGHIMLDPTERSDENIPQILTIRMLMSGKEVGSIIGKKGDNVKKYRLESGARINISDGSCPERIVTVTGAIEQIFLAFNLMCQKFEDDFTQSLGHAEDVSCPPVTLRLLVPATQCGSIIGKGGCKIKDIRELTGASIQVASEVLPNSSERTVTISGTAKAIAKCIKQLCQILLESPPKGATVPYKPKPALPPGVTISSGAPQIMPGTIPIQTEQLSPETFNLPIMDFPPLSAADMSFQLSKTLTQPATPLHPGIPLLSVQGPLATPGTMYSADAMLGCAVPGLPLHSPLSAGIRAPSSAPVSNAAPTSGLSTSIGTTATLAAPPTQMQEILIPNDLIGCIIGRGGNKINEIRTTSGAQIKISNCEEGARDRKITITGSPENIELAHYLISNSIELHKQIVAYNIAIGNSARLVLPPQGQPPFTGQTPVSLSNLFTPISVSQTGAAQSIHPPPGLSLRQNLNPLDQIFIDSNMNAAMAVFPGGISMLPTSSAATNLLINAPKTGAPVYTSATSLASPISPSGQNASATQQMPLTTKLKPMHASVNGVKRSPTKFQPY